MFTRLKNKWKVSSLGLFLIIFTFAIGGSLCGYAGRKILGMFPLQKGMLWGILYILLITILWPLAVIVVSIPMGQLRFFKSYIRRMVRRIRGGKGLSAILLLALPAI